jgi:hypothetical protein
LESRFLLACSHPIRDEIRYFVFQQGIPSSHPDVVVPKAIARKTGIDFDVFVPDELRPEFRDRHCQDHLYPRILPKTCNIQYHYDHHRESNVMNINGNGGGIIKCSYGHQVDVSLSSIRSLTNIPRNRTIEGELAKWYDEVAFLKSSETVTILDAFYWEQRMGQWGGHFPAEQDIAIEEFSPLNNRRMLLAILEVDSAKRRATKNTFFREVVRLAWPQLLTEPINPHWGIKDAVGKTARQVYLSYVLKKK